MNDKIKGEKQNLRRSLLLFIALWVGEMCSVSVDSTKESQKLKEGFFNVCPAIIDVYGVICTLLCCVHTAQGVKGCQKLIGNDSNK